MNKIYRTVELTDENHDDFVFPHIMAMTGEKLHSKAEIAHELGVRDKRIAELTQERDECAIVIASMARQSAKDGNDKPLVDFCGTAEKALEQLKLEMQAKGLEEMLDVTDTWSVMNTYAITVDDIYEQMQELREQAKQIKGGDV